MIKKILFLILLTIFYSCSEEENTFDQKHPGGTVKIAIDAAFEDIVPITTNEISVEQIHRYLLSPSFVIFDEDGEAQPDLADGWKIDRKRCPHPSFLKVGCYFLRMRIIPRSKML